MTDKIDPTMTAIQPSDTVGSSKVGEVYDVQDKHLHHDLAKEDVGAEFADIFQGGDGYTAKEARRLRWKLDLRLIPILWFNVVLPAMDKVSHGTAALYGLQKDLDLHGDQYSWIGSVFYVNPNCALD